MSALEKNYSFLPIEKAEQIIKKLTNTQDKPSHILVTGGEPLIHQGLVEILQIIKAHGFNTTLVTNGELINKKFAQQASEFIDNLEVTFRGYRNLHDIMMQPADSELWKKANNIEKAIELHKDDSHYQKTLKGLKTMAEYSKGIKLGLNIDAQINTDMEEIVQDLTNHGIRVDYINIQIQQISGRAKKFFEVPANKWRQLDAPAIEEYLKQAENLIQKKIIKNIGIIDPIKQEIKDILPEKLLEKYYSLEVSPAVNCFGNLRKNVLFTN